MKLMQPGEVADTLGVTLHTLHYYRKRGIGPAYLKLPGGQTRYPRESVEAYVTENLVQTEGAPAQ